MPLRGAFRALLLLLVSAAPAVIAAVPPPTNVSVSCNNLRTVVSWVYDRQQPPTRFRVEVNGSAGSQVNETTEHELDLTQFVWRSRRRYLGYHDVTVTAVQGDRRSPSVASPSFTFNDRTLAHQLCVLDFPPVNVAAEDSATRVTFQNPFHFYTQLQRADTRDSALFDFSVTVDKVKHESKCTDVSCRYDVPFSSGAAERCVVLEGRLDSGNHLEFLSFRETDLICPGASDVAHVVTLGVLLSAFVLVVCGLTVSICVVRAWRLKPADPNPSALDVTPILGENHMRYNIAPREEFSPVTVMRDDPEDRSLRDGSSCCDGRGTDEDSADEEEGAVLLVVEEKRAEAAGHYDRPHTLQAPQVQDIGDGDMVECYTGK